MICFAQRKGVLLYSLVHYIFDAYILKHIATSILFFIYVFFKCLFLREIEYERVASGVAEREEDRGSKAGSALTAEKLMQGLNPKTMRS